METIKPMIAIYQDQHIWKDVDKTSVTSLQQDHNLIEENIRKRTQLVKSLKS